MFKSVLSFLFRYLYILNFLYYIKKLLPVFHLEKQLETNTNESKQTPNFNEYKPFLDLDDETIPSCKPIFKILANPKGNKNEKIEDCIFIISIFVNLHSYALYSCENTSPLKKVLIDKIKKFPCYQKQIEHLNNLLGKNAFKFESGSANEHRKENRSECGSESENENESEKEVKNGNEDEIFKCIKDIFKIFVENQKKIYKILNLTFIIDKKINFFIVKSESFFFKRRFFQSCRFEDIDVTINDLKESKGLENMKLLVFFINNVALKVYNSLDDNDDDKFTDLSLIETISESKLFFLKEYKGRKNENCNIPGKPTSNFLLKRYESTFKPQLVENPPSG